MHDAWALSTSVEDVDALGLAFGLVVLLAHLDVDHESDRTPRVLNILTHSFRQRRNSDGCVFTRCYTTVGWARYPVVLRARDE
jgi:hypothetical protein